MSFYENMLFRAFFSTDESSYCIVLVSLSQKRNVRHEAYLQEASNVDQNGPTIDQIDQILLRLDLVAAADVDAPLEHSDHAVSVLLEKLARLEHGLVVLPPPCDDGCVDDAQHREHQFVVLLECVWVVEL